MLALTSSVTAAAGLRAPQRHAATRQATRHCAAHFVVAPCSSSRWQWLAAAAAPGSPSSTPPAEENGLLPEEDFEIPGNYRDAMTTNTPLGKAVKGACEELDTLGDLERQTLEEAEGLLKKLGFKGSLFATAPAPAQEGEQQ